jgi:hypothetical protein
MRSFTALLLALTVLCATPLAAGGGAQTPPQDLRRALLLLPDAAEAHPLYTMMLDGVEAATADIPGFEVEVIVTNGHGDERLLEAPRDPRVELVVVAGGALLRDAAQIADAHPEVDVLLVDGELPGRDNVAGLRINRREQAFLAGYVAGLRIAPAGGSPAPAREPRGTPPSAGLLVETGLWQSEEVVRPAYLLGLRAAASGNTLRTERLPRGAAPSVLRSRLADFEAAAVPVVLPVVHAHRGVVAQAVREGTLDLIWLDEESPDGARGRTLVALPLDIEGLVSQMVTEVLESGAAAVPPRTADFASGAMSLHTDTDRYTDAFDAAARRRIERMAERLGSGDLSLSMPAPQF